MAATKKGSTGKKAVKKTAAGTKAGKGTVKANGVAKATKTKPTVKGAAAPKKAAPVKLNDKQKEILHKIHGAGETGYDAPKAEQRTIEALVTRKLAKKGPRDKATGKAPFLLTKAGQKHAMAPASA